MVLLLDKIIVRTISCIIISLSLTYSGIAFSVTNNETLEISIGKLVLLHDKLFSYENDSNPFGAAEAFILFEQEYTNNIKTLPVEYRIKYFWASMWHLDFDGEYMERFQQIVYSDCGEAFLVKLNKYLSIESKLKRNTTRLYLTDKVYLGFRILRKLEEKKNTVPTKINP